MSQLFKNINELTIFIKNIFLSNSDFPGQEPSLSVIHKTFFIMDKFHRLQLIPSCVGPSVESGIGITFDYSLQFAYIEVLNSGEIVFLIDTNGKNMQVWETNFNEPDQIDFAIKKILNHLTATPQE